MINVNRNRVVMPPIDQARWPELADKLNEHAAMSAQLDEVSAQRTALTGQLDQADAADAAAYAAAIRRGEKDPGPKQAEAVKKQIAATERRYEALQQAVADVMAEMASLIERHRDQWIAELDSSVQEARAAVADAVRRWQAEHGRVDEVMALRRWVRQFPKVAIYKRSSSNVGGFHSLNGEALPVDVVAATLLADAQPQKVANPEPA